MFTPDERDGVRARLIQRAERDPRISGAALTGSAVHGDEDRWSDVDLFLGVAEGVDVEEVLADWTDVLHGELGALHHWDLRSGAAIYRVFLLPRGLQVDVAFTPESDFGARGPHFRALFGSAVNRPYPDPPTLDELAGLAWLAILHGNASIARGRFWQAEYWISTARDQTLTLAALRLGNTPFYARELHLLPPEVTASVEDALVRSLETEELRRALRVATDCLLQELGRCEPTLANRLEGPLVELSGG